MYWATRGKLAQAAQDIADHRTARVITIANADEFYVGLRERVESLSQSQRQSPNSIELLVSTAKRYLGRPELRIQLHDLFEQETKSLLQRTDSDEFASNAPWAIEAFRNRRDKYEAMTEPMARLAGVAGRWGDDSEFGTILDIIRSLQRDAAKQSAGLNHYVNIRLYPAVLVFTAYGLGLTRSQRWRPLHQLFSAEIDFEYREPKRAVEVLFPHCWEGGGREIWNQIEKTNLKTPLSDHLCSIFTGWGESFAALTPDFPLLFERFEILGALAYLETNTKEEIEKVLRDSQDFLWMPIGRSLWNERNATKVLAEIQKEPAKSELAKAGFANGDSDVLNLYGANFKKMSARARWM